jgi:hypothetical protein
MKNKLALSIVSLVIILCSCASNSQPANTSKTGGSEEGLFLLDAIEQAAEKTTQELPKKSRIAVVAFNTESIELSAFIIEELIGALKDRGIESPDRVNLDHALAELNFQMSGLVSDETALSIGKFLGASVVITGQMTKFGDRYRFRISALDVEKASRISITRLDVKDSPEIRGMAGGR